MIHWSEGQVSFYEEIGSFQESFIIHPTLRDSYEEIQLSRKLQLKLITNHEYLSKAQPSAGRTHLLKI